MSRSKRSHEGEILVDHRNSPGLSEQIIHTAGGIPRSDAKLPAGSGKGVFESATFSCSHCPNVVVIHPLRNRPRGYCRSCDHYICDSCNADKAMGKECKTYKQQLDEIQEANFLKEQRDGQKIVLS